MQFYVFNTKFKHVIFIDPVNGKDPQVNECLVIAF